MNKVPKYTANDLLALFESVLSPADVIASKLMAQISVAITKERIKLRMTQSEFAQYIGVKQSQISRWEHGNYNFSIEKIADIFSKLNLDINFTASNMDVYQSLDSYSNDYTSYQHGVTFVFKNTSSESNNHIYNSNNLVPITSSTMEVSNYVTLR